MKQKLTKKTLELILDEECTIIDVEAHTDSIREFPEGIERVHVKIDMVKEMDTAYLQCLYSLKKEVEEKHMTLETTGKNKLIDHVCRLYGLEKISPYFPAGKPEKIMK